MGPVTNQGRRQVKKSRRLDQFDASQQVEINQGIFQLRLIGAVNQVKTVSQSCSATFQLIDRGLDLFDQQTSRTKETEHPGLGQSLDQRHGADSLGHRAANKGVTDCVIGTESGITKALQWTGQRHATESLRIAIDRNDSRCAGHDLVVTILCQEIERLVDAAQTVDQRRACCDLLTRQEQAKRRGGFMFRYVQKDLPEIVIICKSSIYRIIRQQKLLIIVIFLSANKY